MESDVLRDLLIKRGNIFLSGHFDNISHEKFFVIIGEDENDFVGFFFINSAINQYILNRPEFRNLQIPLLKSNYKNFLHHDSFLDCHSLVKIKKDVLRKLLSDKNAKYKTELLDSDLEKILLLVRKSPLFSKAQKETFFK
ncbi:MAG: hypothetical protein LBG17_07845 [Bacteroidales bacterium]|jgi:hypothetical protein|nr:hypothetical protein [Bacteroidales bacterium]